MLFWTSIIVLLAAGIVAAAWALKIYSTGGSLGGTFFAARPEPRIEVTEQASVDSRRRLLLIRRDNVEHLIMTGGPVDVVIETGIGAPKVALDAEPETAAKTETAPAVFGRRPRALGQAVNE